MPFRMFGELMKSCKVKLTSMSGKNASARISMALSEMLCWRHDGEVWGMAGENASGTVLSPSLSKIPLIISASMVELENIGDFSIPGSNTSSSPTSEKGGGSLKHEGDEKARESYVINPIPAL